MLQLGAQNNRLDFVETAVETDHLMVILDFAAVIAKNAKLFRKFGGIGGYHTPVPVTTQVFAGEEAETA